MGVGLKLNPMFIDGKAKLHKDDLGLNPDKYIENFVNFLGIGLWIVMVKLM